LSRRSREPINHRSTGNQTEHEGRIQERQLFHVSRQTLREHHNDRKDQRRRTDHCRTNQHRLGRGFESIASAVVFFEKMLRFDKVRSKTKVPLNFFFNSRNLCNG
jgi:hypothetical protein